MNWSWSRCRSCDVWYQSTTGEDLFCRVGCHYGAVGDATPPATIPQLTQSPIETCQISTDSISAVPDDLKSPQEPISNEDTHEPSSYYSEGEDAPPPAKMARLAESPAKIDQILTDDIPPITASVDDILTQVSSNNGEIQNTMDRVPVPEDINVGARADETTLESFVTADNISHTLAPTVEADDNIRNKNCLVIGDKDDRSLNDSMSTAPQTPVTPDFTQLNEILNAAPTAPASSKPVSLEELRAREEELNTQTAEVSSLLSLDHRSAEYEAVKNEIDRLRIKRLDVQNQLSAKKELWPALSAEAKRLLLVVNKCREQLDGLEADMKETEMNASRAQVNLRTLEEQVASVRDEISSTVDVDLVEVLRNSLSKKTKKIEIAKGEVDRCLQLQRDASEELEENRKNYMKKEEVYQSTLQRVRQEEAECDVLASSVDEIESSINQCTAKLLVLEQKKRTQILAMMDLTTQLITARSHRLLEEIAIQRANFEHQF